MGRRPLPRPTQRPEPADRVETFAGLPATVVGSMPASAGVVVLLHGYGMEPEDLAPFARSLGVPAVFVFPRGPVHVATGGRAWWAVDEDARAAGLERGPRDLASWVPDGLPAARRMLREVLEAVRAWSGCASLVLGGFSQGAMLACDQAILAASPLRGLVLMSATRLALPSWQAGLDRVRDLPVLLSHGTQDGDLAFAGGEALRDTLAGAGARVAWVPFDQGHVIPLVVWRAVRKFLQALPCDPPRPLE